VSSFTFFFKVSFLTISEASQVKLLLVGEVEVDDELYKGLERATIIGL
jgi:hypothetical protein